MRFLIWAVLIYLFYKLIKSYFPKKNVKNTDSFTQTKKTEKKEYKIKAEDVIEAEYEEIKINQDDSVNKEKTKDAD